MPENRGKQAVIVRHSGRFAPGQSGNSGGRPALAPEVRQLAQQHCTRAIERLAELIESPDERIAVAASIAMLDRGIGKAAQAIEVNDQRASSEGQKADLSKLSDAELETMQALYAKCRDSNV